MFVVNKIQFIFYILHILPVPPYSWEEQESGKPEQDLGTLCEFSWSQGSWQHSACHSVGRTQVRVHILKSKVLASKVAQQVEVPATKPDYPSLIPRTLTVEGEN